LLRVPRRRLITQGFRAVLEHVDRSREVGRRNRCEVVAKARGAIGAHGERCRDGRRQLVLDQGQIVWSGDATDLDADEVFRTYVGVDA
jgi:hypothetical protein